MTILNKKCNHMAGKCSLQSTALAMATRKSWSHCCCHSPSAKKITQRQNFPFYLLLNRQKLSHLTFPTWWANEQNFQFETSVCMYTCSIISWRKKKTNIAISTNKCFSLIFSKLFFRHHKRKLLTNFFLHFMLTTMLLLLVQEKWKVFDLMYPVWVITKI